MTPEDILQENVCAWGAGKEMYSTSLEQMKILLASSDVQILEKNKENGDGTFFHQALFKGKIFSASSAEKIKNGSL